MMSINDLKSRMADIPGIDHLTMQIVMGRQCFGLNGKLIGVPMTADDGEVEGTIRAAVASTLTAAEIVKVPDEAPSPSAALLPPLVQPEAPKVQPRPAIAPGGFAASLKGMLDDAQAQLAKAQYTGRARVQQSVDKFSMAIAAVGKVSESKAKEIEDAADSVLADLGQISNDLNGEA
jgi:hypothetical protein